MTTPIKAHVQIGDNVTLKDLTALDANTKELVETFNYSIFTIVKSHVEFERNNENFSITPRVYHTVVPLEHVIEYIYTHQRGRYRRLTLILYDDALDKYDTSTFVADIQAEFEQLKKDAESVVSDF